MEKIKALIVNRNLLTTLKNTIEFLKKEDRVEIWVLDQESTYPPLLEYYKTNPCNIFYSKNEGPNSCWNGRYNKIKGSEPFIVADSDCIYDGVPSDWLDKMLEALDKSGKNKVGFSLRIDNLPDSKIGKQARLHESKYWVNKTKYGWDADVDTTFALYKAKSGFSYSALRLDEPYTIKHVPWYLDENSLTDEWRYYLKEAVSFSTWGDKIKKLYMDDIKKMNKSGVSFDVIKTSLNSKFWDDHYSGWENSTFDFIVPRLSKEKTFIDIGTWIGPISLVACQYSKQCICFEPDPVAFKELSRNVQLNEFKNICLENKAVSSKSQITLGSGVLGESITRDSCIDNAITVDCLTVKQILEKYSLKQEDISVIKIDIEGHEQDLLKEHSILWDLNIPMYISFHPGWRIDKDKYFKDIIPFLLYKKIDVANIQNRGNFFDIAVK
jgi:FkbM family methyltransferase